MVVFGVNDRDQEAARDWIEKEGLPFPVLHDPDRAIAVAYGMSQSGGERYIAVSEGGRRPGVIIDEDGVVLKLLPDLATVDQQVETLASLD